MVPTAPMLADPLGVQRALRPLKRRVPARGRRELDEEATAERIAETRQWAPVLVPAPERWLSLSLVVDTGPTMRLWRPLARELAEVLVRQGAFRDVRMTFLDEGGRVGSPPRPPSSLLDPSGRHAVLLLSDCSGPHWWRGRAGRAVRQWAQAGPTAILQPLPERLWRRTAAPAVPGLASLARPGSPNTELDFLPYDGEAAAGTPVPVLGFEPRWFAGWARLVAGSGPEPTAMASFTAFSGSPEPVRREQALPVEERVRRFLATASPEAAELAAHVAVSVPSLPVMRLIQHRVLGLSGPSHLAEVLLSGLLRPLEGAPGQYEFAAGAQEALLDTLPRPEAEHTRYVLEAVSAEIARRAGTAAETFPALLRSPDGDRVVPSLAPEFARLGAEARRLLAPDRGDELLELLGLPSPEEPGEFAERIGALRGGSPARVPIGVREDGQAAWLDFGHDLPRDPHVGVVIGTSRIEVLRTLILGVALTASPEQVSIALLGDGLADLAGLPSVLRPVGTDGPVSPQWLAKYLDAWMDGDRPADAAQRLVVVLDDGPDLLEGQPRLRAVLRRIAAAPSEIALILGSRPEGTFWVPELAPTFYWLATTESTQQDALRFTADQATALLRKVRPSPNVPALIDRLRALDRTENSDLLRLLGLPAEEVDFGPALRALRAAPPRTVTIGLDRATGLPSGPLFPDFPDEPGFGIISGPPGSGKTAALCAYALSLALSHPPQDIDLVLIDHGSGRLAELAELPHVSRVVGAGDRAGLDALVRDLRSASLNGRSGKATFILIDGLSGVPAEEIINRSGDLGVHVAMATGWEYVGGLAIPVRGLAWTLALREDQGGRGGLDNPARRTGHLGDLQVAAPAPARTIVRWLIKAETPRVVIGTDPQGAAVELNPLDHDRFGQHGLVVGEPARRQAVMRALVRALIDKYPMQEFQLMCFGLGPHPLGGNIGLPHPVVGLEELLGNSTGLQNALTYLNNWLIKLEEERPFSLVVIFDLSLTLPSNQPELLATLLRLAQRGRALGIHLLLAATELDRRSTAWSRLMPLMDWRVSAGRLTAAQSQALFGRAVVSDRPHLAVDNGAPTPFRLISDPPEVVVPGEITELWTRPVTELPIGTLPDGEVLTLSAEDPGDGVIVDPDLDGNHILRAIAWGLAARRHPSELQMVLASEWAHTLQDIVQLPHTVAFWKGETYLRPFRQDLEARLRTHDENSPRLLIIVHVRRLNDLLRVLLARAQANGHRLLVCVGSISDAELPGARFWRITTEAGEALWESPGEDAIRFHPSAPPERESHSLLLQEMAALLPPHRIPELPALNPRGGTPQIGVLSTGKPVALPPGPGLITGNTTELRLMLNTITWAWAHTQDPTEGSLAFMGVAPGDGFPPHTIGVFNALLEEAAAAVLSMKTDLRRLLIMVNVADWDTSARSLSFLFDRARDTDVQVLVFAESSGPADLFPAATWHLTASRNESPDRVLWQWSRDDEHYEFWNAVTAGELNLAAAVTPPSVLLGSDPETSLPVEFDFADEPHLLVTGLPSVAVQGLLERIVQRAAERQEAVAIVGQDDAPPVPGLPCLRTDDEVRELADRVVRGAQPFVIVAGVPGSRMLDMVTDRLAPVLNIVLLRDSAQSGSLPNQLEELMKSRNAPVLLLSHASRDAMLIKGDQQKRIVLH
ncbi:hypothetical protein ACRB68_18410 [Actinomadura sp. RB68]|uniref:FtsK domain-containing protein n=2 Tax=Actinomadura macrotermitis TaxID=2585200 RepID=A0A7K0BRG6_9ACTN|nr:hypothetical protein [Actinomadura macrotermitis]